MKSWIQYYILGELTRHQTRKYSELCPPDVAGNLFSYHLNGLLKEGLVEKQAKAYTLSTKGLQFIGTFSLAAKKTRQQPKILNAIVCRNTASEYLFIKWHRQPNIGQISFPHGMMHYGKGLYDMSATELAEKTGYQADLTYKMHVYVRIMLGNNVDRHMLVHIFEAHNLRNLEKETIRHEISTPFWAKLEDVRDTDFVPGFYEIAQQYHQQDFVFRDVVA